METLKFEAMFDWYEFTMQTVNLYHSNIKNTSDKVFISIWISVYGCATWVNACILVSVCSVCLNIGESERAGDQLKQIIFNWIEFC